MVSALDWLLRHTLRSVWFGIILLALIAAYIAVGSGLPGVREYFEKDELAFFNAWPLVTLMTLMVVTLVTVTIERIPFTWPRLGPWIVHTGIITLIFGAYFHYSNKVEGSTLILMNQSVTHYYDRWERAIYFRVGQSLARVPLKNLPRFNTYDESLGNASYLDGRRLKDLTPVSMPGQAVQTAAEMLGVKDLTLSVVGYWPYANIGDRMIEKADSKDIGFQMRVPDMEAGEDRDVVLMAGNLRYARTSAGIVELEHRVAENDAQLKWAVGAASAMHMLTLKMPGLEETVNAEVGKTYPLGKTGYSVTIESFDPRWRTMDQKVLPLLTLMVQTPTQKFRRQVLSEVEKPTDWVLGAEGAGPLGKRQTEPLDKALITSYRFSDAANLQPREGFIQYTFLTTPGSSKTTVIGVGPNTSATLQEFDGASGKVTLSQAYAAQAVMMSAARGAQLPTPGVIAVDVRRQDRAAIEQYVEEVPKEKRNKDDGQSGRMQVVKIRAKSGDWRSDVYVPFNQDIQITQWRGGLLDVPGSTMPAQMQMGNNLVPLPANIRLDKFEADAYGGLEATAGPMMRDFRSTITITNRTTGEKRTDIVYLNNPVFYDNGKWIFFQSGWDNQNQRFTILGVGNRPGVWVMAAGCLLIIAGIFYAFYVKPIIIKAMKENALKRAKLAQKLPATSAAGA